MVDRAEEEAWVLKRDSGDHAFLWKWSINNWKEKAEEWVHMERMVN